MFRTSSQKYKTSTGVLYTYDNILLTNYMEIAQTGNTDLLVITGSPSDKEIQERWELIVKKNLEANGQSSDQLDNIKDYVRLLATYIGVKASLLQLCTVNDDECITFLEHKGYRIDRSSHSAYVNSINANLQKVKNVLTKLASRNKLITESMKEADKTTPLMSSSESMLANISASLGFSVDSNITLARFNEYNKIIKKRIEAQKKPKAA